MISKTIIVRKFSTLLTIALLISGLSNVSRAQSGGDASFAFLNLPASARIAAMGGNSLAINDNDLSLALNNPSLISNWVHNDISLSFVDYYNSINYGFAQYGRSFEKLGEFRRDRYNISIMERFRERPLKDYSLMNFLLAI